MPIARRELEAALLHMYGPIFRIAHTLCGDTSRARDVLDFVIDRSFARTERWDDEMDAQRWLLHHTVLAARRLGRPRPLDPQTDPLLVHGPRGDMEYGALVRAIRSLPSQQEEAIILNRCSRLNERYLAVAMDCSVTAAGTHLEAALSQLRAIARGELDRLMELVAQGYKAIGPPPESIEAAVGSALRTRRRRRHARALFRWMLAAALIAAAAWGVFKMGWIRW